MRTGRCRNESICMKTSSRILAAVLGAVVVSTISAAPTKLVTGPDSGISPQINTYSPAGTLTDSFFADNVSYTGGIRVAMGDILTTNDIITGRGPGATAVVSVFRGSNHGLVFSVVPYGANFTVGVFVAAGDVDGDGRADIVVGPGDGAGSVPNVKVYSGLNGAVLRDFNAFNPGFSGGVRVAAGDINGDGIADLVCGTGPGAAQVSVFSGKDLTLMQNFNAYAGYTGGIFVAVGDVNGDGVADIITSPQTGTPVIKVFSGKDLSLLQSFTAFPGSTNGARVAVGDLNGDNVPDIIVGSGPGDPSRVKATEGGPRGATILDFSPYPNTTAGVFPAAIPKFPPQSLNLSTRANVLTGDNIVIGGFIVNGTDTKDVLIRGMGPSTGVPGALADPTLELFSGNTSIKFNDNWAENQDDAIAIANSQLQPGNPNEAAIRRTALAPGAYTVMLRGKNNTTGIGVVEVYDLNAATTNSQLANISTRGFVQTGNNVMIAGVILGGGPGINKVVVRALGPSLSQVGVTNALSDPTLGLFNSQGTLIKGNDNWKESQEADIRATGLQPSNDLESALYALLGGGSYTAIVAGVNNRIGTSLVEIYNLQ